MPAIGMLASSIRRRPMRRRFSANFPIYEDPDDYKEHECYRESRNESQVD
jgi:hypothetical protein